MVDCDICVFGGTSGGVAAAVAAARLGKNVALVAVTNHLGGMTSGGLSVTDVGNAASIGGIASGILSARRRTITARRSPVYWFEPHVAEQTFLQMLSGAGVAVYTNELLASVVMSNQVITQIVMADGNVYRAKEFIDTTYEGDLMAMAGVHFHRGPRGHERLRRIPRRHPGARAHLRLQPLQHPRQHQQRPAPVRPVRRARHVRARAIAKSNATISASA